MELVTIRTTSTPLKLRAVIARYCTKVSNHGPRLLLHCGKFYRVQHVEMGQPGELGLIQAIEERAVRRSIDDCHPDDWRTAAADAYRDMKYR